MFMTRILIRILRVFSNTRVVVAASLMLLLLAVISAPAIRNVASEAADRSRANLLRSAPPMLTAPTNLSVLFTGSDGITLTWSGSAGAVDHYEIERSENASEPFVLIGNTLTSETVYSDNTVVNQRAYLYRVRGVEKVQIMQPPECSSAFSGYSNMALGTAISFEFTQLNDIKNKPVKARHVDDLRTAINAVRTAANLSPAAWLRNPVQNLEIKAQDIQEMRDRLGEALGALSIPVAAYVDPTLTINTTTIKADHIEQLQTRSTRGSSTGSGRPAQLSDRAKLGEFVSGSVLPLTPVHMNLLPDGRILFWGRDRFKDVNNPSRVIEQTGSSQAYVWNWQTNDMVAVDNPTTNVFCSGHSFLPDGRLLVSGGHRDANADADGEPHLNIFDFRSVGSTQNNSWVRAQDMNKGRWYPYNVMLGNGRTLILSGSYFETLNSPGTRKFNTVPQIYNSDNGCLNTLPDPAPSPAPSPAPPYFSWYPYLELRPDGQVLQIQSPSLIYDSDRRSRLFNPVSNSWSDAPSTNGDHGTGSAVLFDSGNKALVVGGFSIAGAQPNTQAEYVDLQGGGWTRIASMNFKRAYNTATILPNGQVLVTGGTSCPGGNNVDCAERGALNAELWNAPAFNPSQPTSVPWRIMARANEIRAYHSLAVLLPDATVLVAGGGRPGAAGEYYPNCTPITNLNDADAKLFGHTRVEIYSPPYLFNASGGLAARPEITSAPPSIFYGKSFFIGTSGAGSTPQVSLVRLASVTHGFNQDQRQVALTPTAVNGSGITVTGPPDSNKCPPGYYMLFVLNNGVPSIAKIVKVGSTSIFLTDAPVTIAPGGGPTWEQGIEFSSSVNGEITHIRFWKANTETGLHIGHIWDANTHQELGQVTFTCETASGWQQAALATPLPITAGVKYRVTYNVNVLVAKTFNVVDTPFMVGPLTAWSSWFSTPGGTFPTTFSGSNLFADVVFRQTQ
jgi:Domain of unknown function (DUF1929)/Domain of unknown function (DUF4082)